jgi:hypothetical protein
MISIKRNEQQYPRGLTLAKSFQGLGVDISIGIINMDFKGRNFVERLEELYNYRFKESVGCSKLPAHRIAYRKRIIEKAGCFDENLGVAEDIDFLKTVLNLKPKLGYVEPVQVEASDILSNSLKKLAEQPIHSDQIFKLFNAPQIWKKL